MPLIKKISNISLIQPDLARRATSKEREDSLVSIGKQDEILYRRSLGPSSKRKEKDEM